MGMNDLERAQALLPWLITNRLSSADESFVRKVMGANPALQKDHEEQKELSKRVKQDPSVMDITVIMTQEKRLHDLMERIRVDQCNNRPYISLLQKASLHIKNSIKSQFSPSSNAWVFVAVASVVVVQLAILVLVLNGQENSSVSTTYISATKNDNAARSARESIILQVSEKATEADIKRLLKKIGGEVAYHPSGSSYYQIFLVDTVQEKDIDSLLFSLENNNQLIEFAGRGH